VEVERVLVLDRWATRSQGNSSCHSCHTVLYKDGTTSVKMTKLTPPSLMVLRLGTTNDGGVTSPAEAKIIVGGPHTRRGWGGNAGCDINDINADACFDTCLCQGSSQTVSSWLVLGRVIRRADTAAAFTHTLRRCVATDAAFCIALPAA